MVIVKLIGGLGNQLFQYAAARRIAYINNVPLKLDISSFVDYPLRAYKLQPFNVVQELASPEEVARLKGAGLANRIFRWTQQILPYHRRAWLVERQFHFDPAILRASGDVYLEGYWQSEKYFKDIEPIVRAEFTVKTAPDPVNEAMAQTIRRTQSVSLHIRRGDYVSDATMRHVHGICLLEYYYTAVARLIQAGVTPHFFIFSDDPPWAQANLKLKSPVTIVTHNGANRDYEDLRLMSLCHHHIIANSSFSWWGAWLSQNQNKIAFAPAKWFNTTERDTRDLIPDEWHRI